MVALILRQNIEQACSSALKTCRDLGSNPNGSSKMNTPPFERGLFHDLLKFMIGDPYHEYKNLQMFRLSERV